MDYYYETNLGPLKKLAGRFFDGCAALLFRPTGAAAVAASQKMAIQSQNE